MRTFWQGIKKVVVYFFHIASFFFLFLFLAGFLFFFSSYNGQSVSVFSTSYFMSRLFCSMFMTSALFVFVVVSGMLGERGEAIGGIVRRYE